MICSIEDQFILRKASSVKERFGDCERRRVSN